MLATPNRRLVLRQLGAGVALMVCLAAATADMRAAPEPATGRAAKQTVTAREYMVAAAHPLAAQAGEEILERGGNAIDAMVAVQFMLNLVEPQSSGIGGGAFLLYWDADAERLHTFDGRETAPLDADPGYFLGSDGEPLPFWEALVGGRSVGVPGTLLLLETVHRRFGSMDWGELIEPTVQLARRGFEISPRLEQSIASAREHDLGRFDATKAHFFDDEGNPKKAGTVLRNPEFADTLEQIARHGSRVFYEGDLAREIVRTVRESPNPGLMTLDDLRRYSVKERDSVCLPYRAFRVCGMGPPTSGGLTVGQILGILSHFDMAGLPRAAAVHLYLEAAKLAYADRGRYMADSDFVDVPVRGLLDPGYLDSRSALVDDARAMEEAPPGEPPGSGTASRTGYRQPEPAGTSHFVIRDAQGNALSITTTIETGFGSRLMVGGFLLNNELTDFSFRPEIDGDPVANRVEGGKRPRSSMAPTIVFHDSRPYLLLGSPGGSRIINYVAKSLIAVLDWEIDLQEALDMCHFANRNGATELEQDCDTNDLRPALEARGHRIEDREMNSGTHAILIHDGVLHGAADSRREGVALGR